MKMCRHFLFAGFAVIALAACDNDDDNPMSGPPPNPPPPAATDFSEFVREQFAATADDTDPVGVDETEFDFSEDPMAYDDLLQ